MQSYVLTITLNPAIDKTLFVANYKLNHDFRVQKVLLSAGGKGVNVSRALKTLGINSLASGFLAGPNGECIEQLLCKENIKSSFLFINGNSRTNTTIIDPVHKTITRTLEAGPRILSSDHKIWLRKYKSLLRSCSFVVFSGGLSPFMPKNLIAKLIAIAKECRVSTVLDSSGAPLLLGIKQKPFILKINTDEASFVLGKRVTSANACQAASELHDRGIAIVAITCQQKGAVLVYGDRCLRVVAPAVTVSNNVGCGDAFIAGFIAGCLKKKTLDSALKLAASCATASALSITPGFFDTAQLHRIIQKTRIFRLKPNDRF